VNNTGTKKCSIMK